MINDFYRGARAALTSLERKKARELLRLVPKPEGYDLNTRRADKQESCEVWQPRDALYEASQMMEGKDVRACVVIWQEIDAKGKPKVMARRAGPHDVTANITMNQAGHYHGWSK